MPRTTCSGIGIFQPWEDPSDDGYARGSLPQNMSHGTLDLGFVAAAAHPHSRPKFARNTGFIFGLGGTPPQGAAGAAPGGGPSASAGSGGNGGGAGPQDGGVGGAGPQGGDGIGPNSSGGSGTNGSDTPANSLIFRTQQGKEVQLSGDSISGCLASCEKAPELQQPAATPSISSLTSMVGGSGGAGGGGGSGSQQELETCKKFCNKEFETSCFPGDAIVLVRNSGPVPMVRLRVGEEVLVVRRETLQSEGPTASDAIATELPDWSLGYEPVLAFLHRDCDSEGEVLRICHSLGQVHITRSHLILVRRCEGQPTVPVRADEVRIGDQLLAPWIDGSFSASQVHTIEKYWGHGLFAPLVASGLLLVSGTVVSCYAAPQPLPASNLVRAAVGTADWALYHTLAHGAFWPLRMLCSASMAAGRGSTEVDKIASNSKSRGDVRICLPACESNKLHTGVLERGEAGMHARIGAGIPLGNAPATTNMHPYAWVLYVLGASLLP